MNEQFFTSLNGYKVKDEYAVHTYDSVSNMKVDPKLKEGYHVKTKGYYEPNDGGNGEYIIVDDETLVDDGGSIHILNNGLRAKLLIDDIVNVRQFGIYEDDTHDDSDSLQNIINLINTYPSIRIIGNKKAMKITKTIDIPAYSYIEKLKLNFYSGSYINNYCIYVNANSSHNSWKEAYPFFKGELKDCEFYNKSNSTTLNCLYNYSNSSFIDLIFNKFNTAFYVASNYLDGWLINRLTAYECVGTDYAVHLGGLGDITHINQINLSGKDNLLNIGYYHLGIIIDNSIINGKINIGGSNVTINNLHQEGSPQIVIDTATVEINNSFLYHNTHADQYNITLTNNSHLTLKNVLINYHLNREDNSINDIDVNVGNGCDVNLSNCFKKPYLSNANNRDFELIKTNVGLTLNNNQYLTNGLNHIVNILGTDQNYSSHSSYWTGTTNEGQWKKPTDTYYYAFQPLADIDRKIGYKGYYDIQRYSHELTNNSKIPVFTVTRGLYRIYRGTTENSYNEYVDVAHFNAQMYDNGDFINGYKWLTREAGNIDDTNTLSILKYSGDNSICFMDSTPSYGTWKKGDIIYKNDGTKKWLCTTDGTPGTWVEI